MTRKLLIFFGVCLAALALVVPRVIPVLARTHTHAGWSSDLPQNNPAFRVKAASAYGQFPLSFEENQGQFDPNVKFLARGRGYTLFLTDRAAVLRLAKPATASRLRSGYGRGVPPRPGTAKATTVPDTAVSIALTGPNHASRIEGLDLQPGHSNYFIGNDPALWRRNVSLYSRVKYEQIYPGIDLVYYGNRSQIESDYVLAPGADPAQVRLRIEGGKQVRVDSNGDLVLATSFGSLVLRHPTAYQELNGFKKEIPVRYVERGPKSIGVQVAAYDAQQQLVIDPVLDYSTYLGGSGTDSADAIVADASGNAYVTGITTSSNFPISAGAFQTTLKSTNRGNVFITKLNPTGTAVVFSTFLGGTTTNGLGEKGDEGTGIALDTAGNIYVAGDTGSTDFPITTGTAFQTINAGIQTSAFLTKLDPTGATLIYSSYIGGNGGEFCNGLAVDANGNAYITGITSSTTYPITNANTLQTTNPSGETVFISRFDPTQAGTGSLIFSTYFGGSRTDTGAGIAADNVGNVYVTGSAASANFPVLNGFQTSLKASGGTNVFFSKIATNPGSAAVLYSTYLGGSTNTTEDIGTQVALDTNFNAYITGDAASSDFPTTAGALQTTKKNTALSAFVARFDPTKTGTASLIYSTFLGGSTDEFGHGIAVDTLGDAFVTGLTASKDFPVTFGAPQSMLAGATNIYVSELNPTGNRLFFSTYWGGNGLDTGFGIALDPIPSPNVFIVGTTTSSSFPTTSGALITKTPNTNQTGVVAKFSPAAAAGVFVNPSTIDFGTQTVNTSSSAQTATLTNNTQSTLSSIVITVTGSNPTDFTETNTCASTLAPAANCTISITFKPSTTAAESATVNIADSAAGSPQKVTLSGTGLAAGAGDFAVSITPASATVKAGSSTTFTMTVSSANGFSAAVTPSCSGLPANSTCAFSPATVTPPANGVITTTGTINTTKRPALTPPMALPSGPSAPLILFLLTMLALFLTTARLTPKRRVRRLAWSLAVLPVLLFAGCSSLPKGSGGTPAGTSTIAVKGAAGSITHTATFTLTVQ